MVFLDNNAVIDLIEQPATLGSETKVRMNVLLASRDRLVVNDLVPMKCQVGRVKVNDQVLQHLGLTFLQSPDVSVLTISPAVYNNTARLRAKYGFKALDPLHQATSAQHRCSRLFVTSGAQLKRFPEILVETLS